MNRTEQLVRDGLNSVAPLIPDKKHVLEVSGHRRPPIRGGVRAAVLIALIGVTSMLLLPFGSGPNIPQGPCERLWSELAVAPDPVVVGSRANLPTDVFVPADLSGDAMYCTSISEGTPDGPGVVTGLALINSSHTEGWLVVGAEADIADWRIRLEDIGLGDVQTTPYGLTNAPPRTPEVNFWVKAAEFARLIRE